MVERFKQGKIVWVNMKRPTAEEIKRVAKELDIPAFLVTDLGTTVPKNAVTKIDTLIKVTLDFPVVKQLSIDRQYEMKFIIAKNFLLTAHYEEMEGVDRFKRQFEVATTLRKGQKNITGAHLFISLINNLYESASANLDYVESRLSNIEIEIFRNNEKQMVFEISNISKKIIAFRHIIRAHEDIFREGRSFFEDIYHNTFKMDLQNIQGHYFMLQRRVNTQYETLTALRETNIAMLSTKQNEVIKILTIMAFVTFPLTLFSSLFGMNVESAPIIGREGDFWVIVGIMVAVASGFFLFFKRKGWM